MPKTFIKYLVFLAGAAILLGPMLGGQIDYDGFKWDFSRFWRVMAVLAAAGLCVTVYRIVTESRRSAHPHEDGPVKPRWYDKTNPTVAWVVVGIIVVLFPFYAHYTGDRYALDVGINVLIYVALGLGLNLVVGLAGLLDLGYIAFYAVGAYTYALLNVHFGAPFWLCIPLGCVISACFGAVIGYPTLKMRGDYLAIVTLGFGEIIRIILNNWNELTEGPNGILGIAAPPIWYPTITDQGFTMAVFQAKDLFPLYFIVLLIAVVTILGVRRLDNSRVGRAWVAIREDETAAELTGIHTTQMKLMAYMLGAVFAGLAGAFFAAKVRYINPSSFVFLESALVLCIVVLGGMGSIPGIILGAAAIIILPEIFRDLELYRMLAFGAAMAAMMIFRPEGLIPARRRRIELHAEEAFEDDEEEDAAHA